MNKQRFYYIIDNGHGGYVNGEYVNAPSKMFKHKDGTLVEEGIFNRQVAAKLGYFLGCAGIAFEYLVRESEDISLKERVNRINAINKREKLPTLLISLHGNAGKGTGYEVFTSKGQTLSDPIADVFINSLAEEFPFKKKKGRFNRRGLGQGGEFYDINV